jgi:hypothetical protein
MRALAWPDAADTFVALPDSASPGSVDPPWATRDFELNVAWRFGGIPYEVAEGAAAICQRGAAGVENLDCGGDFTSC